MAESSCLHYHLFVREKVLRYIRKRRLIQAGDRVAVAVSGGADSVALLRVLLDLRTELGVVLSVAHFNHGLRGEAAEADEAFVAELARQHDLEFFSKRGDVRDRALTSKLSLEAAARELRYGWLTSLAESHKLNEVATAHTLDDQAETVLLKFLRGAGTRGLAGIYPEIPIRAKEATEGRKASVSSAEADSSLKANGLDAGLKARTTRTALLSATSEAPNLFQSAEGGAEAPLYQDNASRLLGARIIRPLLGVTREEVEQYLTSLGQEWREDESNLDHRFARNRVRHELLPLLEREYNPNIRQVLSAAAELAGAEEEYWQALVERELEARQCPESTETLQGLKSVGENSFSVGTVERLRKTQPRRGGIDFSPGRKPWVKREKLTSPFRDGTVLTHALKPGTPATGGGTAEAVPFQSSATEQRLSLVDFSAVPLALQRRLLRRFVETANLTLDFAQVERLLHCALGELPKAELPGGWLASRTGERLELRPPQPGHSRPDYAYTLPVPGQIHIAELGLTLRAMVVHEQSAQESPERESLLSAELLGPELIVRNWLAGDRFHPLHSGSEEKLKRLFLEQHIPAAQRSTWPVVLCGSQIVWVRGFPVARAFAWKGSGDAVKIEME